MDIFRIENRDSEWFNEMWEVYSYSFPEHEKRSLENQLEMLSNKKCKIDVYVDNDEFVGFVIFWIYPRYIYIEHFALSTNMRQGGRGSFILSDIIWRYRALPIVLDIDPVVDEISQRRLNFYLKLGFIQNSHKHLCPPYSADAEPFELLLLTTKKELTEAQYAVVKESLYNEIITFKSID